jgi:alkylhydroperoxidase family enzyme
VETDSRVLAELRQHLSKRELVKLNVTIGLVNLMNRFNKSFVTGEPETKGMAA